MNRIILTIILCLIASTAIAAPKLCLVWDQQQVAAGGAITTDTRSKIFDTVTDALQFLNKKAIPNASVQGLWELRPAAKQVISATTVEIVEPEIIRERRRTEIQWSVEP